MPVVARIINDSPHDAAFNMAADMYLLSLCEQSPAVFVRLYSWEKPSITLGLSEKPQETLDLSAIAVNGVEWIRRPTGGRSVLHDHDITYSCVFSAEGIRDMGTTLMETYMVISKCLLSGLQNAGIDCGTHGSPLDSSLSRGSLRLPCFLSPNRHEIMVGGKKLLGSAQKRSAKAVLQHGSIPLTPAFRRLPDYLQLNSKQREEQKRLLADKTTCVAEVLPSFDLTTLKKSLIAGFEKTLPFPHEGAPWSASECEEISRLSHNRDFLIKWRSWDAGTGA
jgi:lipoate-protein ligase A